MTLSARPFWVIFTFSILLVIELLPIKMIAEWRMRGEIVEMAFSYEQVRSVLTTEQRQQYEKRQADAYLQTHPNHEGVVPVALKRIINAEDLQEFGFATQMKILAKRDLVKAVWLVGALGIMGLLLGILIASLAFRHLVKFGDKLGQLTTTDKIAILFGVIVGLSISGIFLPALLGGNKALVAVVGIFVTYISVMALMSMKDELRSYFPTSPRSAELDKAFQKPKILDTNVIIDGRISDVCAAGFIEGQILIPSFVLEELQHIADSGDGLKRARGRRGLDILNQMRKELDLTVKQCDSVNPEIPEEVDVRLVKLAKEIDGSIVTNDFNLNKVAVLQGVTVLNINELANALKPVVLPGEEMTVTIVKEGKEMNQGIAYLDDGTMIVIEGARRHIGEIAEVVVSSVLQTVAGKMIFANFKTIQAEEDDLIDRNVRNYSGFRPRKKV